MEVSHGQLFFHCMAAVRLETAKHVIMALITAVASSCAC